MSLPGCRQLTVAGVTDVIATYARSSITAIPPPTTASDLAQDWTAQDVDDYALAYPN